MQTPALSERDHDLLFGSDTLEPGDAVVHFDHGLARYGGTETVEIEGTSQQMTVFVYRNGGKLMLPAEEGRDFFPYGAPAADLTLDRLNAGDWVARRDEMIAELHDSADRLVEEDRARRAHTARPLVPDAERMEAFAATFPHAETGDQSRAIAAVLGDMAHDVPMNRLLIGDVGFGKTEVAVRAVAAAVLAGHQAILAAPTTVLARQHVETLRARLASIGAEVAELSRLTPAGERDAVLAAVASGAAQVVVGTSALLGDGVCFADLALTVIDEEQKFGREDKIALRALCPGCHVLSLTATPIPRSLAAAEVGLVDVSVLAEAPNARQPVETRIAPPSAELLRETVLEEVARGGQAFVVCPRIGDLDAVSGMIDADGDGPSHVVAHGQLSEDELEARMLRFMGGEVDVLLSTSIVESGLDNPRANAMVVCGAERFGLTQLHQLRGRIGRGDAKARMLLLTEVDLHDPEDEAAHRLAAFRDMSAMGDGFRIARRDRDIRGFGELDGDEQSGQLSRLGIGLYRHILRGRVAGDG